MAKMFLFFSHKLSQLQINDAENNFNIKEFVSLPKKLQMSWSNIPSNLESLNQYLLPFEDFLKNNSSSDDILLIQGDFGAVYKMVNYAKNLKIKTVYATTTREIEEIIEGDKTFKKSIFKHRRFREYE